MFVIELSFSDDQGRLEFRPAHRDRLTALHEQGKLVMAGPWADDTGALLVFRADDEEAVRAIMAEDPYYTAPGVTVVSVRKWQPVVG